LVQSYLIISTSYKPREIERLGFLRVRAQRAQAG